MFTGSLVEIEYTLNVHPLTRVTDPRTLNIGITLIVYIKMFVIEVSAQLYVLNVTCIAICYRSFSTTVCPNVTCIAIRYRSFSTTVCP